MAGCDDARTVLVFDPARGLVVEESTYDPAAASSSAARSGTRAAPPGNEPGRPQNPRVLAHAFMAASRSRATEGGSASRAFSASRAYPSRTDSA